MSCSSISSSNGELCFITMDVDCMMLEDVELEPELPATFGRCGGSQHLHLATRLRGDSTPTNPACMRFQTTARTGMPSSVWLDTAGSTASSASWKAERKHSRPCEAFPGAGIQRSSADDAGAGTRSSASRPCSARTVERRTHSTSVYGSIASFCLQGRKRTVVAAPHAEPEAVRNQALSSTNMSLARDHMLGFLTFLVCGVASLCCWQFLLSLMPYIENTFFSGIPVGNSLMGVYQVGCICVQLVLMFLVESMRPWVIVATTVFDAALALLFPIVVANGTHRTKMVLTHIVALLFGVSAGMICGCSLAVASALPYNFIGAFSVGQGIAGILSFIIGLAFKELFDVGSAAGLSRMLWLVYGTSCGVSLVSACLLLTALRQPWAARQLARYWEAQRLRDSTRKWTVMWWRWLGQPQRARRSQVVAAVNPVNKQVAASGRAHEKEGRNATPTEQCEDACAKSNFRTALKAQGVKSNNDSRLAASVSVVTSVEATTLRNPVVAGGAGAANGGRAQGPTPDKQLLRSSDAAREATVSATDTRFIVTAPAGTEARETNQQSSDDSEAPVTPCVGGGSLKTQTKEEGGSRSWEENVSKERRGVCRISFCSRDATCSEKATVSVEEEKLQPSRGWRYMLRDSGIFLVCVFLNFFVTLNLYPRVGPIMWHYPSFSKNGSQYIILFGVFCVGDFFGKCVMDVSKNTRVLSWLMISKKLLLPAVISRLGIAVFFLLGAYMSSHWFFNSFALYVVIMILLAITNGWCATTSLLYVCTSVERLEEREILGPASVLVMQLGIMAGVWTALAYPTP